MFANQPIDTKSPLQNVKLTNSGNGALTITNVSISPSVLGMVNGCPSTLTAEANCTIAVYFDPTTTGKVNGTLTVTDNAADSPQTVAVTGTGVQPDFTLDPTSETTATVTPGQVANYSITVSPVNGFNQTLTLTCSGAPPQSTCTVSPSSVTLDGVHVASANITVATAGFFPAALNQPLGASSTKLALLLAMAGGVLGFLAMPGRINGKRRTQFLGGLFMLCLVSVVLIMPGCGGGSGGGGSSGGATPTGTYNLTVTGTFSSGSSKLTHSTNFTLIVQ